MQQSWGLMNSDNMHSNETLFLNAGHHENGCDMLKGLSQADLI